MMTSKKAAYAARRAHVITNGLDETPTQSAQSVNYKSPSGDAARLELDREVQAEIKKLTAGSDRAPGGENDGPPSMPYGHVLSVEECAAHLSWLAVNAFRPEHQIAALKQLLQYYETKEDKDDWVEKARKKISKTKVVSAKGEIVGIIRGNTG